jgi:hypothetical protein
MAKANLPTALEVVGIGIGLHFHPYRPCYWYYSQTHRPPWVELATANAAVLGGYQPHSSVGKVLHYLKRMLPDLEGEGELFLALCRHVFVNPLDLRAETLSSANCTSHANFEACQKVRHCKSE